MIPNDNIINAKKAFPMILSACLLEPWPIFIEAKGAPPTPIRYANAEMIIIIGAVTPNPANAVPPTSGM